jgi:hypothetical protein
MRHLRLVALALLIAGILLGTSDDNAQPPGPGRQGGFHVLVADFHIHSFLGDGALPPWELLREATRRGLDVIAVTNHNQVFASALTHRLASEGLPLALVGQEVTSSTHHIVAIGIRDRVDWRLPSAAVIDAIHAQGGIAIAAHPLQSQWRGFDDDALRRVDATEIAHSMTRFMQGRAWELVAFFDRAKALQPHVAPIGDTDFHFNAPMGLCRTFVFAREINEAAVLDAIRAGRTVAYDNAGHAFGDPALVEMANAEHHRRAMPAHTRSRTLSIALSLLGLFGMVVLPGGRGE